MVIPRRSEDENGASVDGNGRSVVEHGRSVIGNGASVVEHGASGDENGRSVIGNESSGDGHERSVLEPLLIGLNPPRKRFSRYSGALASRTRGCSQKVQPKDAVGQSPSARMRQVSSL